MENQEPNQESNELEIIFEPIRVARPRDDRKGLAAASGRSSHGFNGIVFDDDEDEIFHIHCNGAVPTKEEMKKLHELMRYKDEEEKANAEAEAEEYKEEVQHIEGWREWLNKRVRKLAHGKV